MQIYIETQQAKKLTILVESSDTIRTVIAKIQDQEGIPPHGYQRLALKRGAVVLQEDRTLADYNIQKVRCCWQA